jgi:hypothetical protein
LVLFGPPAAAVGLKSVNLQYNTLHRGAFCQFPFRWIYYYASNKSTGKETGKTHLCALLELKFLQKEELTIESGLSNSINVE